MMTATEAKKISEVAKEESKEANRKLAYSLFENTFKNMGEFIKGAAKAGDNKARLFIGVYNEANELLADLLRVAYAALGYRLEIKTTESKIFFIATW